MAKKLIVGLLIGGLFAFIVQSAMLMPTLGAGGVLIDFDAFYIVGQLFWEGRTEVAYDLDAMSDIQRELVGHDGFMPWTYPPQFDLLTIALPLFERGVAFALFTCTTLTFYLWCIWRLAREGFFATLLLLVPPIFVAGTIGQNAFLTGGLMALFCLLAMRDRVSAGWALGALVIKPHLGIGLGLYALFNRRWRVIGIALIFAGLSSAIATLVFGPMIWAAFFKSLSASGELLQAEFYPLFRMMSVYAALHTAGIDPQIAIWVQAAVALIVCAGIAWAARSQLPGHQVLAMACFGSALISPYLYDYDMTTAGVGVALICRDVLARTTWFERAVLVALVWVAGGWGLYHALVNANLPWEVRAAISRATFSYGAVAYLIALGLAAYILRRPVDQSAPKATQ